MDMPGSAIDCRRVEEEDLIGRYLRDELPPAEAEAFEMHYFECDRCWPLVQAAMGVRAVARSDRSSAPQPSTIRPFFASPALKIAATVLLAAGAVLLVSKTGFLTNKTQALVRAAGGVAPLPVRLTGDFAALGPPAAMRGPAVTPSATLRRSADRLIEPDEQSPSARTAHEAGAAKLLLGDWNGAIECLTRANQTANVLADLSAAYLARGIETGNQADIRAAIDSAQHSLRSGATPEALFNYAEALDRLQGADRASRRAAWEAYLAADPRSEWASLARRRLDEVGSDPVPPPPPDARKAELRTKALGEPAALDQAIAADSQLAREYVEEEILVEFLHGPRRDATLEATAASIAGSLRRVTGNALPEETVVFARETTAGDWSSSRRRTLADAHAAYSQGQSLYRRREIASAASAFDNAERDLGLLGSPFAVQAGAGRVGCLINANQLPQAYQEASALRSREELQGTATAHTYAVARLEWAIGLVRHFQGYSSEAIASLGSAATLFARLREREGLAALEMLLAQAYDGAGDFRGAWRARERAMNELEALRGSSWQARILGDAAAAASAEGQHHLARYLLDRQVDAAPVTNEPLVLDALVSRALEEERLGELGSSREDLQRASQIVSRMSDRAIRDRSTAQLALLRARLDVSRSIEARIDDLDAAVQFFEPAGNHVWLADAFEERGRLELARGSLTRAEADWRRGVRELEMLRERAGTEDLRISTFATGRRLFDDLVGLLVTRGRAAEAFELAEEARARALLDRVLFTEESQGGPLPSADLRARLGSGTTLVSYFALPDRLCIWAVSRDQMAVREVALSRDAIRRLVEAHWREVRGESPKESEEASRSLYRATIEPVESVLAGAKLVVFVPDDVFQTVSFASLRSHRGRRVVELWPTQIAPSARYFVVRQDSRTPDVAWPRAPAALVLVGTSAAAPLVFVRHEVADVSSELGAPLVVEGRELTKDRFFELAIGRDVIHFAGHGLGDKLEGPSALLLGPNETLFPGEIQKLDLRGVRLVYLSACSTAAGALRPGEGPTSIARAFLAAGAREVVATLWPVDDATAAAMAVRFYRFLRSGETPASALQRAQLEFVDGSSTPGRSSNSWAAFQLLGAARAPKGG